MQYLSVPICLFLGELLLQVAPKVNFMNEDIDELRNLAALILHGQGTFGTGL